ncbi:MAG: 2,3-bisphosphoglycerate-independent phosphoglycerate mutase [Firmicutes bacterium]|nr:2,3-bisphosphoglycerate-independent phosphoglycerate mutase [Bacillota bacterium]
MKKTKYLIVLGDGMADYPDNRELTPLMEANKPFIDELAKVSEIGLVQTVPLGMAPGSDTANLSVMGYNPKEYYTGRSPLEASSIGIKLSDGDVCYRMNFVTLSEDELFENKIMLDYSGGEIETEKARKLIEILKNFNKFGQQNVAPTVNDKNQMLQKCRGDILSPEPNFDLFAGTSYRNALVWRGLGQPTNFNLTPPHDFSDKQIGKFLPPEPFLSFIKTANSILNNHPENDSKANAIWIWGEGTKPNFPTFYKKFGMDGAVISEVDLVKGIGICADMTNIAVEGADGSLNTNYEGMAEATIEAFDTHDFVYLHIEAPDECGHKGDRLGKIKAIEFLDGRVVKPLVENLTKKYHLRMLFLPDHATPLALKTHTNDAVPYLLFDSEIPHKKIADTYAEASAKSTGILENEGCKLIEKLLSIQ